MLVILLFIIILNVVSIVLMYYCLADLTKKEKLIYIAGGTAFMYVLTTIVYWISTRGITMTEVSEMGKNLITFLFVPINGIIILPMFAKSYYSYKMRGLDGSHGVMIPVQNINNLQLSDDVVDAVKNKKFHIYAVSTIEEGIEVLTGVPAGRKDKDGNFPAGTINYLAYEKLKKFAKICEK